MVCHAVRIKTSTKQADNPSTVPSPEPPELANVIPDRVQNNVFNDLNEVLPGQNRSASKRNTEMDGSGTEYVEAVHRVDPVHSKSTVLDKFENNVVADAEWYKIERHDCDHNEDKSSGCGDWVVERSKGNPPSGV